MRWVKKWLKNIAGSCLGYGTCSLCNRNTLWRDGNNPGIATSPGSGRIICDECYEKDKANIDLRNHRIICQLIQRQGYTEYGICCDPNCVVHKDEWHWVWNGNRWIPPKEA